MATSFDIGDQPVITTTFSVNGTPTTPSARTAMVRRPDGTETVLTPTVSATGVLVTTLPVLDVPHRWYWRVKGTAGVIAADEGYFTVRPSNFTAP